MLEGNKSLDLKLIEWLEKQGYPLEMTVAQAFQNSNYHVTMSSFYKDYETDQPREIDVTAQRMSSIDKPVALQFSCHIECKLAREKPWVIFVPEVQPDKFLPFNTIASRVMRDYLYNSPRNPDAWRRINSLALFQVRHVGYGVTQAFTNGQDVPYQAVMGAIKAAVGRAIQLDNLPDAENRAKTFLCGICIPVIVIDGNLFECRVTADGQLGTTQIETGVIEWKSPNPTHSSPLVYIVTKPALTKFIDIVSTTAEDFIRITEEHTNELATIVKRVRAERSQIF